ncbi:MAG: hypothetical protein GY898_07375 [Proteobacteria bacterium]|nr:hypothetical protein [Pseudomonadota bacterium]
MQHQWNPGLVCAAAIALMAVGCSDVTVHQPPEREGDDPGECYDGADNDGNGLFDCDDPDCSGAVECAENDPPSTPEISISPADPTTEDTLLCIIDVASSDPDGHAVSYRYFWTVDGSDAGVEDANVDAGQTTRGEAWLCTVIPEDEFGAAGGSASATVSIGNAPPTRPEIGIEPSEPTPFDPLQCTLHEPSTDPDGDDISYTYDWYKNGAPMGFGPEGVPWEQTEAPDEWACVVTPNDGLVDGPSAEHLVTVHVDVLPHSASGTNHTCSVQMDGQYTCWGSDSSGQIAQAPDVSLWQIESGDNFSCGIVFADTGLLCWGDQSWDQHLPPLGTYVALGVGATHACAVTSTGELNFWGSAIHWSDPVPDHGSMIDVTAGTDYCCGMNAEGYIDCWGDTAPLTATPNQYRDFDAGAGHLCAISPGGTLTCWGTDGFGQTSDAPLDGDWLDVTAGLQHSCAIENSTGFVTCWGDDSYGQASAPTGVFTQISAGAYHTCGKRPNDTVDCWGCVGQDAGQCTPTF